MSGGSAQQVDARQASIPGTEPAAAAAVVNLKPVPQSSPWNPHPDAWTFTARRLAPDAGRCTVRDGAGNELTMHPCRRPPQLSQEQFEAHQRRVFLTLWGSGTYNIVFFKRERNRVAGRCRIDIDDPAWPTKPCAASVLQPSSSEAGAASGATKAPPAHGAQDAAPAPEEEGDEEEIDGDGDEEDDEAEFSELEAELAAARAENKRLKAALHIGPATPAAAHDPGNPYALPPVPVQVAQPPAPTLKKRAPNVPPLPPGMKADEFFAVYMWCESRARDDASERLAALRAEHDHTLALDRQRHGQFMAEVQAHYARSLDIERSGRGTSSELAEIKRELRALRDDDDDDDDEPEGDEADAFGKLSKALGAIGEALPAVVDMGKKIMAARAASGPRAPAHPGLPPNTNGAPK